MTVLMFFPLQPRLPKRAQDRKFIFLFCNRGDTIQYHGGLWSRELCQAPMLLVFLTPRQALSSHPRQCFCASLKLLFFMIFVGVHEFSSRLTTFSSSRRQGSNSWLLDHKSNASPLHHGGLPLFLSDSRIYKLCMQISQVHSWVQLTIQS